MRAGRWVTVTAALTLALAACGDGEPEEESTPTPTATVGMEATPPVDGLEHVVLGATLTGEAEVPEPGDPDGVGTAKVDTPGPGSICYNLSVENIDEPAAAHIHEGTEDEAGDIVVDFAPTFTAEDGEFTANGCVDVDQALVDEIFADPAAFYVNVHNEAYPAGAVRGQLEEQGPA
ncbi:MAG: CHRD domain-containing protein [Actinomycetota bacterium]|nr:CHRD domain-containing protein [Actinomycetota bacterium]